MRVASLFSPRYRHEFPVHPYPIFSLDSIGGHAFEKQGLHTLRLPTPLYEHLRSKYLALLAASFDGIVCAYELPSKESHGDIDFLVEGPRDGSTPEHLAESLGAKTFISNGLVTSYALAHPDEAGIYVQLDIQICSKGFLQWQLFMGSYGDLSQILGVVHRSLGLSSTDKGLHVRIPEIENKNRKASMIYLTHDPIKVMEFLGLDTFLYTRGFNDENDVFEWVASGRFFNRIFSVKHDQQPSNEKSNDRARRMKRAMYRRFVEEWMVAHPSAGSDCCWTRDAVLAEALDTFELQGVLKTKIAQHRAMEREDALWVEIRGLIPKKKDSLRLVIRGLKKWVDVQGDEPCLREEALSHDGFQPWSSHLDERGRIHLLDWIHDNWTIVQAKEKEHTKNAQLTALEQSQNNNINK